MSDASNNTQSTFIYAINGLSFFALTVLGGIAFWFAPQQTISEDEKRTLMVMPTANARAILSGKFEKQFEEYYNDHFVFRNDLMAFANQLNALKGIQDQEFRVLTTTTPPDVVKTPTAATPSQVKNSSENIENAKESEDDEDLQAEFSKVKGMVIVNGRVVQNFGGSKSTIAPFANLLNSYRKTLNSHVNMYVMIAPAGSDFYLPKQITKGEKKEKQTIDILSELIDPGIISVPAYDELSKHKNEYIMYRTDHHWTGLGAYYAYRAFAKVANFTPLELQEMEYVKAKKDFVGSLYLYSKDNELKKNPDVVEYYKVQNQYSVTMQKTSGGKFIQGVLYYPNGSNYGVFLGGDYPLVHITSDVKNGRKALIIKDSFGNAFAPYLVPHFEEVFVVDYRYYKSNIPKFIHEHGVTDFIYAHNSFAANSHAVVKFGQIMLGK